MCMQDNVLYLTQFQISCVLTRMIAYLFSYCGCYQYPSANGRNIIAG